MLKMEGLSWCSCCCLVLLFSLSLATLPFKKFEYKLSFKGPHLVQKDGSIPFWDFGGDAIASDDNIRITPSLRSKKGWVWSRNQMTTADWMIEVTFRVTGRGRIGADGLAIWYATERMNEGPVFGGKDNWNGLGIFMDSFDNDGLHNNPYILAVPNDGNKAFAHQNDGTNQMVGGCLRDFRNKPYPVRAKIEYNKEMLTVWVQNGMYASSSDSGYELCFNAAGVRLPRNGYFGVSAATGGLADDHDVLEFMSYSYTYPEFEQGKDQFSEAERQKYEKEYEEYQDQLKQAREDYRKDHPDAVEENYDEDKYFESQGERELNQIYLGQNTILDQIRSIDRKMDEVIGRQERMLSMVSQQTQGVGQPQAGQQQGGQRFVDTITRQEVDRMFANQQELSNSLLNVKTALNDLSRRSLEVTQGQAAGGGNAINNQLVLHEIKDRLSSVKQDTEFLLAKPQAAGNGCPPPADVNCISPMYFYLFMIGQIVVFIGYSIYRQSKEAQAKKFY